MTRWRSFLMVTAPAALAIATAVHLLARSADASGCGWGHWLILATAQLAVAAAAHPLLYAFWRRP